MSSIPAVADAVARPRRLDAAADAHRERVGWLGWQAKALGLLAGGAGGGLAWLVVDLAATVPAPLRLLAVPAVIGGAWAGHAAAARAAAAANPRGHDPIATLERAAGGRARGRMRAADELAGDAPGGADLRRRSVARGDEAADGVDAAGLASTAAVRRTRVWLLRVLAVAGLGVALGPTAAWVSLDRALRPLTALPGYTPHAFAVTPRAPLIAGEAATLDVVVSPAPPWWVGLLGLGGTPAGADPLDPAAPPPVRASLVMPGGQTLPLTPARGGWSTRDDAGPGERFRGRVAAPADDAMVVRVVSDLGESREIRLPVDASPRVVSATATVTPPAYTGRPARVISLGATPPAADDAGAEPHAELEVLAGSTVEVAFATRVPLASAAADRAEVALEGTGGTLRHVALASGDVSLRLRGEPGGGKREALRLRVTAVPDAPPTASVGLPAPIVRLAVSQTLEVPLALRDDVAISGAGFAEGRNGPLAPESALPTAAAKGSGGGATAGVTISPAAMGLVPGDFLRGRVVAEDNRPAELGGTQRSEPAGFGVLVVSDEQMEAILRESRRVEQLLEEHRALQDAVDLLDAEREVLAADLAGLAAREDAGATEEQLAADRAAAAAAARRLATASETLAKAFEDRAEGLAGYDFEAGPRAEQAAQAERLRGLAQAARTAGEEQDAAAAGKRPGPPAAPGSGGNPPTGGSSGGDPPRPASGALAEGAHGLRDSEETRHERAEAREHDFLRLLAADELFGLRDRLMEHIREQRAIADEAAALRGKPPGTQRDAAYRAISTR